MHPASAAISAWARTALCAALAACALALPAAPAHAAERVAIDAGAGALVCDGGGLGSPIAREVWIESDSTVDARLRMRFELTRLEDASAVDASWAEPSCVAGAWEQAGDGWWYLDAPIAPGGRVEASTELSLADPAGVYGLAEGGEPVHLRETVTIEATGEEGAWDDPARAQASSDADAGGSWPKTGADAAPRNRAMALSALLALSAWALIAARRTEGKGE